MAKKPNPWVEALQSKKAAVDLHPDVLRAVLKMNPQMRGGDRSTEEVGQALMDTVQPSRAPQPAQVPESRFRKVFHDMLDEFSDSLKKERASLDERRKQLERDEELLRQGYIDRVVEFLVEVQPGSLSEASKETLTSHVELLRSLRVEVSDINRRVREASASYKK